MRSKDRNLMNRIKSYIDDYVLEHYGRTPTMREIGAEFSISHVSAYRYLVAMDELGMVVYKDGEIHTEIIDKIDTDYRLVGAIDASVPAGIPDMVDDAYVEEYFPLPSSLLRGMSGKFYSMPVRGDSMISAGIDDGDIVIFKEAQQPSEGDIVVAFIDGEGNTLKRYCTDKKGSYLWAENEMWSDKKRICFEGFSFKPHPCGFFETFFTASCHRQKNYSQRNCGKGLERPLTSERKRQCKSDEYSRICCMLPEMRENT